MAPPPKRSSPASPPAPVGHSYNGLPPVDWYPEPGAPAPPAPAAAPPPPVAPYPAAPFPGAPYQDAPQQIPPPPPAAGVRYCQQCGAVPAVPVTFGWVIGVIFWFRMERTDAVTCRSCGRSFGRAQQSKTMMTGWWGVIAFFVNLWWIIRNAISLGRLARLAEPVQRTQPALAPGRPVFLRAGMIFAAVLFGGWIWYANSVNPPTWSEGSCVRVVPGTTDVEPVDCSEPHFGRIIAVASSEAFCPAESDSWVEVFGEDEAFCIDEGI